MTENPDRSHNNPPELLPTFPPEVNADAIAAAVAVLPVADEAAPYNVEAHTGFLLRVTAFADACGKWRDLGRITSQDQSERLSDFVTGARGLYKTIEESRKSEKGVWDAKASAVQAAYAPLIAAITKATDKVKPMQADWLQREQFRIDAENREKARIAAEARAEAERMAAQAAARNDVMGEAEAEKRLADAAKQEKAAARPVKASSASATGGGRTMSLRTTRTANIVNQNAVYMRFRDDPAVRDVLQRLANQAVRSGESFPENIITIFEQQVAA